MFDHVTYLIEVGNNVIKVSSSSAIFWNFSFPIEGELTHTQILKCVINKCRRLSERLNFVLKEREAEITPVPTVYDFLDVNKRIPKLNCGSV